MVEPCKVVAAAAGDMVSAERSEVGCRRRTGAGLLRQGPRYTSPLYTRATQHCTEYSNDAGIG